MNVAPKELSRFLRLLSHDEHLLAQAIEMLTDRYRSDAGLRDDLRLFADRSRRHFTELQPFLSRYHHGPPSPAADEPERIRAMLFHAPRLGLSGVLRDLQDLGVLAHMAQTHYSTVLAAAQALGDSELEATCRRFLSEIETLLSWISANERSRSAQALLIPEALGSELRESLPARPTPSALPDLLFAPIAAGFMLLVVGVLSVASRNPWLLPSLGPTAYLVATQAPHPETRFYNVFVGHLLGLGFGLLAVTMCRAWDNPAVLQDGVIDMARVGAATIAVMLTIFAGIVIHAQHAPAGATAMLVGFGALASPGQGISVVIGAFLMAVLGVFVRRLRTGEIGFELNRRGRVPRPQMVTTPHRV